jgi:hypothetical protein
LAVGALREKVAEENTTISFEYKSWGEGAVQQKYYDDDDDDDDVIECHCNMDKDGSLWPAGIDCSAFSSVFLLFPHVT